MTLFLVLAGFCASASGQGLLSTFSSPTANSSDWNVGQGNSIVQGFTTGSSLDAIESVSIEPGSTFSNPSDLTITFYSDASGNPGSALGNGSLAPPVSAPGGVPADYTASGLTLAANTSYWLVFQDTAGTTTAVQAADGSVTPTSTDGWTLGQFGYGANGGPYTYSLSGQLNPLFSINALQPAPEPGTLAVWALGAGLLLRFRKKLNPPPNSQPPMNQRRRDRQRKDK